MGMRTAASGHHARRGGEAYRAEAGAEEAAGPRPRAGRRAPPRRRSPEEVVALREAKLAKFGPVLRSHVCGETGAGAVVLDHQDGSTVACYFLPHSHRCPFKLEDLIGVTP